MRCVFVPYLAPNTEADKSASLLLFGADVIASAAYGGRAELPCAPSVAVELQPEMSTGITRDRVGAVLRSGA